jgi:hypothetical protein
MPGMEQAGQEDAGGGGKERHPGKRFHVGCHQEKSGNQESEPASNEVDHRRRAEHSRVMLFSDTLHKMRKPVTAEQPCEKTENDGVPHTGRCHAQRDRGLRQDFPATPRRLLVRNPV